MHILGAIMELLHGDCLEKMKDIPDKTIPLIICDPPYNTTPLHWDKLLDFNKLWDEFCRIRTLDGVVLIFGQEPFSSQVRLSNLKDYRYDWYWEKERLTNVFQVKRRPGKVIETISVFFEKPNRYFPQYTEYVGKRVTNKIGDSARWSATMGGNNPSTRPLEYIDDGTRHPTQVLRYNRDDPRKAIHPTQKPVSLLEFLIKSYTTEGETILDCCAGSFTSGIACMNTNRDCILIEKDDSYFEAGTSRINLYINKP